MYLTQLPCASLQLGNAIIENDLFTNSQSKPRFPSVSQHAMQQLAMHVALHQNKAGI